MFGKNGKQYAGMISQKVEELLGDHLAKQKGENNTTKGKL